MRRVDLRTKGSRPVECNDGMQSLQWKPLPSLFAGACRWLLELQSMQMIVKQTKPLGFVQCRVARLQTLKYTLTLRNDYDRHDTLMRALDRGVD